MLIRNDALQNEILSLFKTDSFQNIQLAQETLYEKLMQDTNGAGKLYKYKPCDAYALSSIICGNMYCSEVSQFNDPFDSRFSFTAEKMLYAILARLFLQISLIIIASIKILQQKLCMEQIPLIYHSYIQTLLDYKDLQDCFVSPQEAQQQNFNSWLENHAFSIFCERSEIPDVEKLLKEPTSWALDIICDKEGLQELQEMVPTDIINQLDSEQQQVLKNISNNWLDTIYKTFYIGCLANTHTNRLMWAHYADSHRGICIEYDFSQTCQSYKEVAFPIEYRPKLPNFPYDTLFEHNDKNEEEVRIAIADCLLTKDNCWEYEGEWRILHDAKAGHMCDMPPISCIYLGAKIEEGLKATIMQLAKDKNIPIKQMIIKDNAYELFAQDIKEG